MCHETYPPRIYLDISPVVEDLGEQRKLDCQLTLIGTKDAQGVKLRLKSPPTMRGIFTANQPEYYYVQLFLLVP